LTLTWCGAVSFRWVHFNFLQVFSLSPLLFWSYFNWQKSKNNKYLLYIAFLICQMTFAGHMQTTFIMLVGLVLLHLVRKRPFQLRESIYLFGSIVLGFILAAPQIIPTMQLSHYSARSFANPYQYVVSYIFNSKDLIGFFSSQSLGTPLNANYGNLVSNGSRIYWENTPYIGELFIVLLFCATVYYSITHRKLLEPFIFLILSLSFLILAFGGDSPLYFLFSIFPFNMFRTPSRYLLASVFFLILYSAYIFKSLISTNLIYKIIVYSLIFINCGILIITAFNYHLFIDSRTLLNTLTQYPKITSNSSYITYGGTEEWNKTFASKGWHTQQSINTYLFLNSALLPNSNLINGLSTFDVYTGGLKLRRNEYLKSIVIDSLDSVTSNESNADLNDKLEKLLHLYNIGTIVSLSPVDLPHFSQVSSKKMGEINITFWNNSQQSNTVFYIPSKVTSVLYLEDIEREMSLEAVSEKNAFAESLPTHISQNNTTVTIQIANNTEQKLHSIIDTSKNIYIVAKKGWYPEWHLFIDGKEQKIYKTNLIHMGFYLPKGKHSVEFVYIPTSFYVGCLFSTIGIVFILILIRMRLVRS
ncbi:MAG: hypothetical protein NTZ55_05955, partial [Candidatus Roizmanbacteria bacterium]|nr:hypothetical protein [Candidatus Roizmanbacteria bacterium]